MDALAPAFTDPVASTQTVFRAVMDAMARPGTIRPLALELSPPTPLTRGAGAVALTLLDYETPVWLDPHLAAGRSVSEWLRFHTGAPVIDDPRQAAFAFIHDAGAMPSFDRFALGTMEYPDRSTTLVVRVEHFGAGWPLKLKGPGIASARSFSATPLPKDFKDRAAANRALFPRGVDLLFVTNEAVAALPRSTRVLQGA